MEIPRRRKKQSSSFLIHRLGKRKDEVLKHHALPYGLGENSPLGRMYDLDAKVLLIGTSFESVTAFHLAEYRISQQDLMTRGAPF